MLLTALQTKEAQARREEMLQAIGKRATEGGVIRPRVLTMFETASSSSSLHSNSSSSSLGADEMGRTIDGFAEEAEQYLEEALKNQDSIACDIQQLMQLLRQVRSQRTA